MSELVSIIIPVYNAENYLHRCLTSVCAQSYTNLQIIVVNDGSFDRSSEIITEFAAGNNRITVLAQENQGVSAARNTGMAEAKGEYMLFVDADDFLEPEAVHSLLENARLTGADIVVGNLRVQQPDGTLTSGMHFSSSVLDKEALTRSDLRFNFFIGWRHGVCVWGKLFRNRFLKQTNLQFQSIRQYGSEDMLFTLKYYTFNPCISLLNQDVYRYVKHGDSLSHSNRPELGQSLLNMLENYYGFLVERSLVESYQDVLDFVSFNVISVVCNQAYRFSAQPYQEIKKETRKLLQSEQVRKMLQDFSKGMYINNIKPFYWQVFARFYSLQLKNGWIGPSALLQLIRFKLI